MVALLEKHRAALVISHSSRYPTPATFPNADFVYFRFHGPREMFASSYSDAELQAWAEKALELSGKTRHIYAYFNNDAGGHAPRNAAALRRMIQSPNPGFYDDGP